MQISIAACDAACPAAVVAGPHNHHYHNHHPDAVAGIKRQRNGHKEKELVRVTQSENRYKRDQTLRNVHRSVHLGPKSYEDIVPWPSKGTACGSHLLSFFVSFFSMTIICYATHTSSTSISVCWVDRFCLCPSRENVPIHPAKAVRNWKRLKPNVVKDGAEQSTSAAPSNLLHGAWECTMVSVDKFCSVAVSCSKLRRGRVPIGRLVHEALGVGVHHQRSMGQGPELSLRFDQLQEKTNHGPK